MHTEMDDRDPGEEAMLCTGSDDEVAAWQIQLYPHPAMMHQTLMISCEAALCRMQYYNKIQLLNSWLQSKARNYTIQLIDNEQLKVYSQEKQ